MPDGLPGRFDKPGGFQIPALRLPHMRTVVFAGLLLGFIVWTALSALDSNTALDGAVAPYGRAQSPFFFALSLWSAAAGVFFAIIATNPFAWLNGKRLAMGAIAFAMILGRLVAAGAFLIMPMSPSFYGPLVYIGMPFVLLVAGICLIFAIGAVVGLVFYIFVAAPVAIFNQIFAFERSLAVYRPSIVN